MPTGYMYIKHYKQRHMLTTVTLLMNVKLFGCEFA